MPTIDVQVHCYERNHPGRPWEAVLAGPPEVTGADMIKAMDEVGVDGALLISVYAMYRWDASYAVGVHKQHPNRFARDQAGQSQRSQGRRDDRGMGEDGGTVAMRIMMTPEVSTDRRPIPASTACWRRPASTTCRSTCWRAAGWSRWPSSPSAIPTRRW